MQFTAVPWMRDHIHGEIENLVGAVDLDPSRVAAMVGDGVKRIGDLVRGDGRGQPARPVLHARAARGHGPADRGDVAARGPRRRGDGRRRALGDPDRRATSARSSTSAARAPGYLDRRAAPAPRPRRQDGAVPRRRRLRPRASSTRSAWTASTRSGPSRRTCPPRPRSATRRPGYAACTAEPLTPRPRRRRGPARRTTLPGRRRGRRACWWPAPAAPTRWRCWRPPSSRRGAPPGRSSGSPSTTACRTAPAEHAAPGGRADGGPRRRRDRLGPGRGAARPARAPRRPPARRGTPCWPRSRSGPGRRSCCSGTPSTTRPRRCCSGWPAARGAGRWPGMRRGFDAYRRPLLDVTRAQTEAACRRRGHRVLDGPAQRATRGSPGPGCGTGAAGARGASSAPGSPPPWPAPPTSSARTPPPSTSSPATRGSDEVDREGALDCRPAGRAARGRCCSGCSAGPRSRRAVPPPSCSGCTCWRWSSWSPDHPVRSGASRSSCPATSPRSATGTG